jgi:ABC-2 type transport system permease protein
MAVETMPVAAGVIRNSRRSLTLWGVALAAIAAMYVSVYPAIGGADLQSLIEGLPEGMVEAMGYDQIGTPAGYISSTVYGLLAPILLSVFAIGAGARLIGGEEELGALELEFAAPVARSQIYVERMLALWANITILVVVVTVATGTLAFALDLELSITNLVAASVGLWLLILGFGTVALAAGAITGRKTIGLAAGAGLAVVSFMLDAIGPTIDVEWMTTVSPFSWYLGDQPLQNGFDVQGLVLLVLVPVIAGVVGLRLFDRRDLMV